MIAQGLGPNLFEFNDVVRHKKTGLIGPIVVVVERYGVIDKAHMLTQERDIIVGDSAENIDFELVEDRRRNI